MADATITETEISALPDMAAARKLMKSLGVETRKCNSLAEAKGRLRAHMATLKASSTQSTPPMSDMMVGHTIAADREKRQQLRDILEDTKKVMEERHSQLKRICAVNPDTTPRLDTALENLKQEDCSILVAGETSAGKSTFVNLLLGEMERDLLPVAHLSCSSVISVIRYGQSPSAVVYPWPDDDTTPRVDIKLSANEAHRQLEPYIYQKGDRKKRFPYYKVEIFWDSPWLEKAGICLVDSPGVGESPILTDMVQKYLSHSFGFIYILNSSNAGGIQADRLEDLLHSAKEEYSAGHYEDVLFDPKSVIFIANKWDQVPTKDQAEVHRAICEKLGQCCPDFTKSHMYPFSAKESRDIQRHHGGVDENYNSLLQGIKDLLPASLKQRLIQQHRILCDVVWSARHALDVNICSVQQGGEAARRVEVLTQAMKSLEELKCKTKELQAQIDQQMEASLVAAEQRVRSYLQSSGGRNLACKWKDLECPTCDKQDTLKTMMVDAAKDKIGTVVNKWEREEGVFRQIQTDMINQLESNIGAFHQQLRAIQNAVITGFLEDSTTERSPSNMDIGRLSLKIPIRFKLPFWAPVAFFFRKVFYGKDEAEKLEEEVTLMTYGKHKREYMGSVSRSVLKEILKGDKLLKLMEKKITQMKEWSVKVQKDIPTMIQMEECILQQCRDDIERQTERLAALVDLQKEFTYLHEKSCGFDLLVTKIYDHDGESVLWKDVEPFARGKHWTYYRAQMPVEGKAELQNVTLKVPLRVNGKSAAKFIAEEESLSSHGESFLVTCMGAALKREKEGTLLPSLVLDTWCCSLETIVHNPEVYIPPADHGDTVKEEYLQKASNLAHQIADGLSYLHCNGLIHGDLTPRNILVNEVGYIQLAECGRPYKEDLSYDDENACYMAPEVTTTTSHGYDWQADVFSYGLVLWELWYGKPVTRVYRQPDVDCFHRDAFLQDRSPHPSWRELILTCTSVENHARPKTSTVCEKIKEFASLVYPISTNYDVMHDAEDIS